MDSRLWRVNGRRPSKLRRNDLPQVAQAIVDAELGRAEVRVGHVRGASFVNIHKKNTYDIVVLGEDWAKIVPFLRNSTTAFTPPPPPPAYPPPPIPSPQPKTMMQPPPPLPANGLTSFLEGFDFPTLSQIQGLLSTEQISGQDIASPGAGILNPKPTPPSLSPPVASVGALNFNEQRFYQKTLDLLNALFPERFPTSFL
jgi:hypothetical protein